MKRLCMIGLVVCLCLPLLLTACGKPPDTPSDSDTKLPSGVENMTVLEKLRLIKSDWTEEQVYDLMGPCDRPGWRSAVMEDYYIVDEQTDACISFWESGIVIVLVKSGTDELIEFVLRHPEYPDLR